jgi:hypothetical protein
LQHRRRRESEGVRIWVRNSDGEVNSTETKKGNKNKNKIK